MLSITLKSVDTEDLECATITQEMIVECAAHDLKEIEDFLSRFSVGRYHLGEITRDTLMGRIIAMKNLISHLIEEVIVERAVAKKLGKKWTPTEVRNVRSKVRERGCRVAWKNQGGCGGGQYISGPREALHGSSHQGQDQTFGVAEQVQGKGN